MWPQFLRGFANTLVVAYAADGLLSLLDVSVDVALVGSLRNTLATLVVLQSVLAIPLLGLTRRLPLSVFAPIVASALWFSIGALPLVFMLEFSVLERILVFFQLAISLYGFARIRALREGQGWLFDEAWFAGRLFSFPYFVAYGVLTSGLLLVSVVVLMISATTSGLERMTNGFVRFDSEGVSIADRIYDDYGRRIRLVGMMHIGEEEAYRVLFRDLGRETSSTIVLTEGVSDSEGALEAGLSYAPLAEFLGVEQQRAIEDYVEWEDDTDRSGPVFLNADVDVSEFQPRTIAWLASVSAIYAGGDVLARFLEVYREMQNDPETAAIITEDIISRRNERVISQIEESRSAYSNIVVPWGALHLPGIELAVEKMGFVRRSNTYIPLISWSRLATALLGSLQPQPEPEQKPEPHEDSDRSLGSESAGST